MGTSSFSEEWELRAALVASSILISHLFCQHPCQHFPH